MEDTTKIAILRSEVRSLKNRLQERDALLEKYREVEARVEAAMKGELEHPMEAPPSSLKPISLDERREQLVNAEADFDEMKKDDEGYDDASARVILLKSMIKGRESRGED